MNEESYFQFPLCLLAMPGTHREIAHRIGAYSRISYLESYTKTDFRNIPFEDSKKSWKHVQEHFGFDGETKQEDWELSQLCCRWVFDFEKTHSTDATVRMKPHFVQAIEWGWEHRDPLPARDFRVLCAIYSAIGRKPYMRIALSWIQHRSAGCKSKAVFDGWKQRAEPLTEKAIRLSVARLHEQKFFARSTFNQSQTFYSHRMDEDKLREEIVKAKTQPAKATAALSKDEEMTRKIKAMRQGQH
jgi:hypothetical protein